jgi:hypothetical protein
MAEIIRLPSAAPGPVKQTPRKGRLPKAVGKLWEARNRRYAAREREGAAAREEQMIAAKVLYWVAAEVTAGRTVAVAVTSIDPEGTERAGFFGDFERDRLSAVDCLERAVEARMERD